MSGRARTGLILAGLMTLGIALRLYRLGEVPFGFHPDEGHNALDAWRIVEGWRPVFLPRNNGREPLFMYLMAGPMALLGPSIWSARLAGVVAGALMIPAQYLFVQALPLPRPRRTALISAALVAITFWPVAQARYALRANLLPVWVALTLWAWWRALYPASPPPQGRWRGGGEGWAALTGVFLAAAVYTHLTGRLLGLALVASGLWVTVRERRSRPLGHLAIALMVTGVLIIPQAQYFRTNPGMASHRADQVSVFNPEVNRGDLVGMLVENGWRIVLMPFLRGDASWYHNLSRRPVFDPVIGLAFLVGLAFRARDVVDRRGRRAQAASVLVIAALAVTLAPSWLSVGAPNYVRLTGIWPGLFLLPAWGLERAAAWLEDRRLPPAGGAVHGSMLIGAALGLSLALTVRDYFGSYATAPQAYDVFNGAAVERGRQVAVLVAEGPTYVSPAIWNQSVIRFVNLEEPPTSFDQLAGLVLPPAGDATYAFEPADLVAAEAFGERWPTFRRKDLRDSRGELSLITYGLARNDWPELGGPAGLHLPVSYGGRIELVAARVEPEAIVAGDSLAVTLEWRAAAPTEVDMTFFVHVVGPDGRTYGQFDGPPLAGSYMTDRWRPGERIQQTVTIRVADGAPPGSVVARTGWYDWRTADRLPVPGDDDAAVEVGTVDVE